MSLLGFVTGAASLFGGSSGSSTTSTSTSTAGTQEQASQAAESKTGTASQSTTSSGTSTTGSTTAQTGTTTGNESSVTAGQTTNFSADILAQLDQILSSQLGTGGAADTATTALTERLKQIQTQASQPAFDVQGYVNGITQQAAATTQADLDSRINAILSATGSSEGGNSMAALLGNRLRNDAAANLAGIQASATAQGNQLLQQEQSNLTSQISGLSGDLVSSLNSLLSAAKGGTQTTTGAATTASTQQQQQTGTTQTSTQETLNQNVSETQTSNTQQQGLTSATAQSTTNEKSTTKPTSSLFDNILNAFAKSASAA